jgi:hypothetical protein
VNITSIARKPESQAATATTTTTRQKQLHQKRQHSNCKRYRHKYPFSNTGRHYYLYYMISSALRVPEPWQLYAFTSTCIHLPEHQILQHSCIYTHLCSILFLVIPTIIVIIIQDNTNIANIYITTLSCSCSYSSSFWPSNLSPQLDCIILLLTTIGRLISPHLHIEHNTDIMSIQVRSRGNKGSLFTYLFTRWIYLSIHASVIDLFIHNSFYLESTIYIVHMYVYTVVVAICIPVALLCLHPRYFRAADRMPSVTVTHQRCQSPNFPQKVMPRSFAATLSCPLKTSKHNFFTSYDPHRSKYPDILFEIESDTYFVPCYLTFYHTYMPTFYLAPKNILSAILADQISYRYYLTWIMAFYLEFFLALSDI